LLKSAEILVANLETPISGQIKNNRLENLKNYLHWCKVDEAIAVLDDLDFDYLSLGNNHSLDQGAEGIETTFKLLSTLDIGCFGAGKSESEASKPIVIKNKLSRGGFEYREKYKTTYHFYAEEKKTGVNKWTIENAKNQIRGIKDLDSTAIIIAFPHWGANYKWKHEDQELLAEQLIREFSHEFYGQV